MCVCRFRYLAWNTHALYCHLWPAPLYNIFSHFLINGTIVFFFLFSVEPFSETFLILGRNERDMIKINIGLHVNCSLFLSDFNETWIFYADFRKVLQYQISWKSVQWEPSRSMQTDGHDVTDSRVLQFCESTKTSSRGIHIMLSSSMDIRVSWRWQRQKYPSWYGNPKLNTVILLHSVY